LGTGEKHIVIVGGGTAGWLSALIIQSSAARAGLPVRLSIVESSRIPTIGVGEGTTAVFRVMLKHLGFDEFEFLRETGATIKFGIRHKDWRRIGVTYDGPIDDPHLVVQPPEGAPPAFLDVFSVAAGRPVAQTHLFAHLMERQKGPFARRPDGSLIPAGPFHHAFHFDQSLVGKYLRTKAKGIDMVDAEVVGARKDAETGDIEALELDGGAELAGDFFIDCTGFRKRLIVGEMGGKWHSYAKDLPVNRAMPFWLDHNPDADIAPYTLAWAREAGWMWAIPTQERMGCGYVYSDHHLTPEGARAEIERALGRPIEPRADLKFDIGRLDQPWISNCLAVGLSSSFLEPLEATSIHGTVVQMMLFTQEHLRALVEGRDPLREAYNAAVTRQVDDFRDFIGLHYVSERDDTDFWRGVKADFVGARIRERLELWHREMPQRAHFVPFPGGLPHMEEQLHYPVLDGLGLLDQAVARKAMAARPRLSAEVRQIADGLVAEYRSAAGLALGHRAFLASTAT
jgi:tryptophan 7-halogenase